jgi:hypothetical protein
MLTSFNDSHWFCIFNFISVGGVGTRRCRSGVADDSAICTTPLDVSWKLFFDLINTIL